MEQILEQRGLVAGILRKQGLGDAKRLSTYCMRVPCEGGELWYHNLTGELLFLDEADLRAIDSKDELVSELANRWFLVPEQFDEPALADQVRTVVKLLKQPDGAITTYVILTTTDCNARCYYCYELGRKRVHMTDDVAHDVASYIAQHCKGKPVNIQWFGGEPLYNPGAIDIIANDLSAKGVEFSSVMVSNGYLFNQEIVERSAREWHLERVQITLDGTEDVYNHSKAYIYHEGSPYQRVMSNIGLLLDAGMRVSIRLNMDSRNADDLDTLASELLDRFGSRENLSVYTSLLKDFGYSIHEFESWKTALGRHKALQDRLVSVGLRRTPYLARDISINRCMADHDGALAILPDGRLGKCEHESEENLIGSIYEDSFDQNMVDAWKEVIRISECDTCLHYPQCVKLKKCDWNADGCTERAREQMRVGLVRRVLNEYERYQQNQAEEDPA